MPLEDYLIEDGMRDLLITDARITDVVGDRIRPGVLDEDDTLPAIVVTINSEDHHGDLDESSGLISADILLHAIAHRYRQARQLGKRIVASLGDEEGPAAGGTIQSLDIEDETYTPVPEGDDSDRWRHVLTVRCTVFYQPQEIEIEETSG